SLRLVRTLVEFIVSHFTGGAGPIPIRSMIGVTNLRGSVANDRQTPPPWPGRWHDEGAIILLAEGRQAWRIRHLLPHRFMSMARRCRRRRSSRNDPREDRAPSRCRSRRTAAV